MPASPKNQSPAVLAVLATPNYLRYARQVFASAHLAGRWQGDYLLLSPEIGATDREWFESRGIFVRDYGYFFSDEEWKALPSSTIAHRCTMERLNLYREEFKRWRNVVYLDTDTVVLGPLARLARVKEYRAQSELTRYLKWQFTTEHRGEILAAGLNPLDPGFCAGVVAFPTSLIGPETFRELTELMRKKIAVVRFAEQTILNLYFHARWKRLPLAYGSFDAWLPQNLRRPPRRALVLHFAGGALNDLVRPWDRASPFHAIWKANAEAAETLDFGNPITWRITDEWRARIAEMLFVPSRRYVGNTIRLALVARYHEGRVRITDRLRGYAWYPKLRSGYRWVTRAARVT